MEKIMGFAQLTKKTNFNNNNKVSSVLSTERGWILTKHAKPGILDKLTRTSERIGSSSVFGVVKKLLYGTSDNTYVIKFIKFSPLNTNKEFSFMTEVKIGSLRRIGKVGPRVIAYRKTIKGGEYVMDNVEMGDKSAKSYAAANKRIKITPELWILIKQTINNFYKITKGYHGDLHGNNIMIVINKTGVSIKIIDYGAHRRFNINFGNVVHMHKGYKVYQPGGIGQKFIHNKNFLKTFKNNKSINSPKNKTNIIYHWKKRGLIHKDYNKLYETYLQSSHCNVCKKKYTNSFDRCMDHCHKTGKFRQFLCQDCNKKDKWFKIQTS